MQASRGAARGGVIMLRHGMKQLGQFTHLTGGHTPFFGVQFAVKPKCLNTMERVF